MDTVEYQSDSDTYEGVQSDTSDEENDVSDEEDSFEQEGDHSIVHCHLEEKEHLGDIKLGEHTMHMEKEMPFNSS